jgi:hypothetical protein
MRIKSSIFGTDFLMFLIRHLQWYFNKARNSAILHFELLIRILPQIHICLPYQLARTHPILLLPGVSSSRDLNPAPIDTSLLCQDRYFIQVPSIVRWHGRFPLEKGDNSSTRPRVARYD